jgi:hypothetical protein
MFTGGLQRVARLTVDEYESQKKKNEERQAIKDQKKVRNTSISTAIPSSMNIYNRPVSVITVIFLKSLLLSPLPPFFSHYP